MLFYALCLTLYATHLGGPFLLGGCWLFVALRAVHSAIQCTYNKVMHRFSVYFASTVLLFALWAWLAVELIRKA